MGRPPQPLALIVAAVRRWLALTHIMLYAGAPGQGLVEYSLVLVLIMVVCVSILALVGHTLSAVWYNKILEAFPH
jgi:Flp pilus assembly pilin Flp